MGATFSHKIMRNIVKHTNTRIQKTQESFKSTSKTLFSFTNDIDETEIRAFIGLMCLRGLAGLNNHNTKSLYHFLMGATIWRYNEQKQIKVFV